MIRRYFQNIFPKYWIKSFIFILIFIVLLGLIGSAFPLNNEQIKEILEQAEELIPVDIDAKAIFFNNYRISLIMLSPCLLYTSDAADE